MKRRERARHLRLGSGLVVILAALVLVSCSRLTLEPVTPPSPSPLASSTAGSVHFVAFDGFPTSALQDLVTHCRDMFDLTVHVLPALTLESGARDAQRNQLVAEELITLVQRRYPELAARSDAAIIGFTREDMYARAQANWRFVFGWRQGGRFGVISSARLDPYTIGEEPDDDLLRARLRKTVARYVGLLHYRLPFSDHRGSVLYRSLLGVDDLDIVGDKFVPIEPPSGPAATTLRSYIIRDHGVVELAVPAVLRHAASRRRQTPLVVRFLPDKGDYLEAWMTVAGRASGDPNYARRDDLRGLIEETGRRWLAGAVEKTLDIHEIRGAQASGYYFTLTSRAPTSEPPRHVTLALARVGDLLVTLTIQHEAEEPTERRLLLAMVTTAKHRWDGLSAYTPATVPRTSG